jgi:nucleotidyltransferase substrate binding protein (TIGR01987 family)
MIKDEDIRWEQRFSNYRKALNKLSEAINYIRDTYGKSQESKDSDGDLSKVLDKIIKEGLIQRFEYTFELSWNVMKDFAVFQGNNEITGSRDAIRYAFSSNLISKGDLWMEMIKSRINTTHTYNEVIADEIYHKIIDDYFDAFKDFEKIMEEKRSGNQQFLF